MRRLIVSLLFLTVSAAAQDVFPPEEQAKEEKLRKELALKAAGKA